MDAVKLEGGRERLDAVRAIVAAGIPVQGHLGLTPQSVHQLGGFRSQGRTAAAASRKRPLPMPTSTSTAPGEPNTSPQSIPSMILSGSSRSSGASTLIGFRIMPAL